MRIGIKGMGRIGRLALRAPRRARPAMLSLPRATAGSATASALIHLKLKARSVPA